LKQRGLWSADRSDSDRRIVAIYDDRNATGSLTYQVVRFAPKAFRQRRPNGSPDSFVWDMAGVSPLPYRLPELLAAPPDAPVFICEGERDVDRLAGLGLIASTNNGGAGKWRPELSQYFTGRKCLVVADNDAPGRAHAADVAAKLANSAAAVRIFELPRLPPKGDVSDWLDAGGSAAALQKLAESALASENAPPAQEAADDDATEIARLASLPPIAYDRERREAARRLDVRPSTLDRLVQGARGEEETAAGQGRALRLVDPVPWPEPVDGAALLADLAAATKKYVVLADVQARVIALWIVASHALGAFSVFPRIFVTAPEKGCGKTTL
jgi:hypothetical protein